MEFEFHKGNHLEKSSTLSLFGCPRIKPIRSPLIWEACFRSEGKKAFHPVQQTNKNLRNALDVDELTHTQANLHLIRTKLVNK